MDKDLKKLLNSFKCPICQSQIDGIVVFHCSENLHHYLLKIDELEIFEEIVHVGDNEKFEYRIHQQKLLTIIYKINYSYGGDFKITQIKQDYKLFDFQNLNKDQILDKINLLLTFS